MIGKSEFDNLMLRTSRVVDRTGHIQFPDGSSEVSHVPVMVRLGDLQLLRRLARRAPFEYTENANPMQVVRE